MLHKFISISLLLICGSQIAWAETPDFERLADKIKVVEGVPYYGIKSVHWSSYAEARRICIRTCRHALEDWQKSDKRLDYLTFLANRYCPVKADRVGNKRWIVNIHKLYKGD